MKKNISGFISIFLALISLPIYSFALLAVDSVKILSAKNHLLTTNEIVKTSIYSNYDKELYEKYSIFAQNYDKDYLNDFVSYIYEENINNNNSKYYKAFINGFDIKINSNDMLTDTNNFKKQIIDYMKLEAPYRFSNGFLNLFDIMYESKEYTKTLDKKFEFEEEYSKFNNNFEKLYELLINYENKHIQINQEVLDLKNKFDNLKKNLDKYSNYKDFEIYSEEYDLSIEEIEIKFKNLLADNITAMENIINLYKKDKLKNYDTICNLLIENKDIFQEIYNLSKYTNMLIDEKDTKLIINEIKSIYDQVYNEKKVKIIDILDDYSASNINLSSDLILFNKDFKSIINLLNKISKNMDTMNHKKEIWKDSIEKLKDSQVKDNFNSEYETIDFGFNKTNVDNLINKLNGHILNIQNMIDLLQNNGNLLQPKLSNLEDIYNNNLDLSSIKKLPSLNNYKVYRYIKDNEESSIDKSKRKEANTNKEKLFDYVNNIDTNKVKSPSNIYDFIDDEDFNKILNKQTTTNLKINKIANFSNFRNILNDTSSNIPVERNNIIENLYIAMYLVDKFSDKLDSNKEFNNEIEYILFGNERLKNNNSSIDAYILSLRFLLNSIYAYTNVDLGREAGALATAIAGWSGVGVPLLKSVILSGMSFGESMLDVNTINNDKSLVLYKNKASWNISISSLPKLLKTQINNIANNSIDNIFEIVENYTLDSIDNLQAYIDTFINQTIDGVTQSVLSEIFNPIQTIVLGNIKIGKDKIKLELDELFSNININQENNNLIYKIKVELFEYMKNKIYSEIDSITLKNYEQYFKNFATEIEKKIKAELNEYSSEFKSEIVNLISNSKIDAKIKVKESIQKYFSKLGYSEELEINGVNSGLTFKYKDYLTLITCFRLNSHKEDILKRALLLINMNMKKENEKFDVTNMFVNFSIDSSIKINTFLLRKYIFEDEINETMIGGY